MRADRVMVGVVASAFVGCLYISEYDACSADDCIAGERCVEAACRGGEGGENTPHCRDVVCDPAETVRIDPTEVALLEVPEGEQEDRLSDRAVALCDGYAVVGAPRADRSGSNAGTAYVFSLRGGLWQAEEIRPTKVLRDARFGSAVACVGDMIFVGAPGEAGPQTSGAVYVYQRRDDGVHSASSAPLGPPPDAHAYFGCSVALSRSFAIIGACGQGTQSGQAYVYRLTSADQPNDWIRTQLDPMSLKRRDRFGFAVDIIETETADVAMVGAPGRNVGDEYDVGEVFFFSRQQQNAWVPVGGPYRPQGRPRRARYGSTVALASGFAAAGAPGANLVRTYYLDPSGGLHPQDLSDEDAEQFGDSVAFDGDTLWVGAPGSDDGKGAVHPFAWDHQTNQWQPLKVIQPDPRVKDDRFGRGLSLFDGRAVVGAWGHGDEGQNNSGAAYIFAVGDFECTMDGDCLCRGDAPCQGEGVLP